MNITPIIERMSYHTISLCPTILVYEKLCISQSVMITVLQYMLYIPKNVYSLVYLFFFFFLLQWGHWVWCRCEMPNNCQPAPPQFGVEEFFLLIMSYFGCKMRLLDYMMIQFMECAVITICGFCLVGCLSYHHKWKLKRLPQGCKIGPELLKTWNCKLQWNCLWTLLYTMNWFESLKLSW